MVVQGSLIPTAKKSRQEFDPAAFLSTTGIGRAVVTIPKGDRIFSQGDEANAIFYMQKGRARLSVVSSQGKEATVTLLGPGDFIGEDCIANLRSVRLSSAVAMSTCILMRIDRAAMLRVIKQEHAFSGLFVTYLLKRNSRIQEDLVDQLFNSSEKRLARALLQIAHFGKDGKTQRAIPKISQELLAEIVGTTRSRVNFFMNRFRKLGFIEYNGGMTINSSLINVILHD